MNYFNFFENAQNEKKGINLPVVSAALVLSAAVVLTGIYVVSKSRMNSENDCLSYLTAVENDPAFSRRYTLEKELEKRVSDAQEDCVFLGIAGNLIENGSSVSKGLVDKIAACFSQNTKIVKLTVSGDNVSIEGVAENLDAMIASERALKKCDGFGEVFIDSAKDDGHAEENGVDAVSFKCRIVLSEKGNGDLK